MLTVYTQATQKSYQKSREAYSLLNNHKKIRSVDMPAESFVQ